MNAPELITWLERQIKLAESFALRDQADHASANYWRGRADSYKAVIFYYNYIRLTTQSTQPKPIIPHKIITPHKSIKWKSL